MLIINHETPVTWCRPIGDGAYATLAAPGGPLARAAPPRDPRRRPTPSSSAPPPHRPTSPQPGPTGTQGRRRPAPEPSPGPSGARGGPPRLPPGFETVDLTVEEDEEMEDASASPSPNVSKGRNGHRRGGGPPRLSRHQPRSRQQ